MPQGSLLSVDHLLIGAPMYNFAPPSSIKTWIDHVVKDGVTFRFGPNGPEGLVTGKKVCVISARGGDYTSGDPAAPLDMVAPWLRNILGFLGITDFTAITAEGMDLNPGGRDAALAKAREEIVASLAAW